VLYGESQHRSSLMCRVSSICHCAACTGRGMLVPASAANKPHDPTSCSYSGYNWEHDCKVSHAAYGNNTVPYRLHTVRAAEEARRVLPSTKSGSVYGS